MKRTIKFLLMVSAILPMQSYVQQDMGKSHVAMAYVCWHLANGAGYERDSDFFSKMISMLRKMPEFKSEQHYEFMYKYGCLEPLINIKRAGQQGMLN
ncbi:hypothetical protein ACQKP8_23620 [Photobacterium alginatilyticum]|uniref:hypothetical protein n=1 Tax=Photobacterium alginatilyticum TaxID=1775171 RepID=UPI0040688614